MERQIQKRIYNHKNTRCHAIMNEGQGTGNNVICKIPLTTSTFLESVTNGTLGFQIQKFWIWIESIESFLRVDSIDSKSFSGFTQRNRKFIFGFEIRIWILTKGTDPKRKLVNVKLSHVVSKVYSGSREHDMPTTKNSRLPHTDRGLFLRTVKPLLRGHPREMAN